MPKNRFNRAIRVRNNRSVDRPVDKNKVHQRKRATVNTVTIIQKGEKNNNAQVRLLQIYYMFEPNKTLDMWGNPVVLKKGIERKKWLPTLYSPGLK